MAGSRLGNSIGSGLRELWWDYLANCITVRGGLRTVMFWFGDEGPLIHETCIQEVITQAGHSATSGTNLRPSGFVAPIPPLDT